MSQKQNLSCRVDTYDSQHGPKSKYQDVGVLITQDDGRQYILLEPTVSIAGILAKQNELAAREGKPPRTSVMVGVYDNRQSGPDF